MLLKHVVMSQRLKSLRIGTTQIAMAHRSNYRN